ncbi:quinoprotein dehydrogenase-associated SoxYZ-like carrier [Nitrospirillum sp. BR 11163]|uniref:quinoprotein dehydrogenase-associated SoxYZ-like carrier n=1 Tax=Nitrospirillum sp. BR 11163 TaxID=3104323 RepID=UPI002AFEBE33|nr:quinoprotein dehydrogenase-associated SoxYZ-like carrier [Nitrospirillum sp. BR 11163]MEA1673357.1 quinoprotein dehydrogenase-associated SoxYZ-like carrier [Nitrospirillum sp. BR 11163]
MKSRLFAALLLSVLAVPLQAWAEDPAADAARWQDLRQALFANHTLTPAKGQIALVAPDRAMDAALVPVTLTLDPTLSLKALYLVVDNNPAPLVGTFHFGPAAVPVQVKTRVRVDAYTHMHAVAETTDGRWFVAERYVKAAGGCSAPATKDAVLAMERLGQMRLKMVADGPAGLPKGSVTAQLLISHPNYNGMQMDQVTRNYTPARFVRDVTVKSGDALVFTLEADISLSEDPALTFSYRPQGPLAVTVRDSTDATFSHSFQGDDKG